jgi:hypothetical protein
MMKGKLPDRGDVCGQNLAFLAVALSVITVRLKESTFLLNYGR